MGLSVAAPTSAAFNIRATAILNTVPGANPSVKIGPVPSVRREGGAACVLLVWAQPHNPVWRGDSRPWACVPKEELLMPREPVLRKAD